MNKESVTESMRRLSNIVNEAEQVDEGLTRFLLRSINPREFNKLAKNNTISTREINQDEEHKIEQVAGPSLRKFSHYLSFARTKTGNYVRRNYDQTVVAVFDTEKLKNIRGAKSLGAIDFFRTLKPSPYSNLEPTQRRAEHFEFEDRLLLNQNSIPNADQYIKEIHIHEDAKEKMDMRMVIKYLKSHNIKGYMHDDRTWKNLNKSKANEITLSNIVKVKRFFGIK